MNLSFNIILIYWFGHLVILFILIGRRKGVNLALYIHYIIPSLYDLFPNFKILVQLREVNFATLRLENFARATKQSSTFLPKISVFKHFIRKLGECMPKALLASGCTDTNIYIHTYMYIMLDMCLRLVSYECYQ